MGYQKEFITLTRAPHVRINDESGTIHIRADAVIFVEASSYKDVPYTLVYTGDTDVSVVETPEQVLKLLGQAVYLAVPDQVVQPKPEPMKKPIWVGGKARHVNSAEAKEVVAVKTVGGVTYVVLWNNAERCSTITHPLPYVVNADD